MNCDTAGEEGSIKPEICWVEEPRGREHGIWRMSAASDLKRTMLRHGGQVAAQGTAPSWKQKASELGDGDR